MEPVTAEVEVGERGQGRDLQRYFATEVVEAEVQVCEEREC